MPQQSAKEYVLDDPLAQNGVKGMMLGIHLAHASASAVASTSFTTSPMICVILKSLGV